jgi:hypothetical protein
LLIRNDVHEDKAGHITRIRVRELPYDAASE